MYALILTCIQNGATIRMGPFQQLNYAAATQVDILYYTCEIYNTG